MIYLAIDYGVYEGWKLVECKDAEDALERVRGGWTYGEPWKILKELKVSVEECDDEINHVSQGNDPKMVVAQGDR